MNIKKIQQNVIQDVCAGKASQWRVCDLTSDDLDYYYLSNRDIIIYVLEDSEMLLRTSMLKRNDVKELPETIIFKLDDAIRSPECQQVTFSHTHNDSSVFVNPKGEEVIHVNSNLLKTFEKDAEFEAIPNMLIVREHRLIRGIIAGIRF